MPKKKFPHKAAVRRNALIDTYLHSGWVACQGNKDCPYKGKSSESKFDKEHRKKLAELVKKSFMFPVHFNPCQGCMVKQKEMLHQAGILRKERIREINQRQKRTLKLMGPSKRQKAKEAAIRKENLAHLREKKSIRRAGKAVSGREAV